MSDLLVILLVVAVVLAFGLAIWAVVDASRRPDWAFEVAEMNKTLWVALPLGLLVIGLGWVAALVYLFGVRPKLEEVQHRGERA